MVIGEIIKTLITTDNYVYERVKISDETINFIREMLKHDYEYFKDKEEAYQSLINLLNNTENE